MAGRFQFDPEKAVEVILYIAQRLGDPGFHKISKILYFADLNHLEKFGRLITGDAYVAMKHGPVPSGSYDILKYVREDGLFPFAIHAKSAFSVVGGYSVRPLREPEVDLLSRSDCECLDAAISKYGNMSFRKLTDLSHVGAWTSASENDTISLEEMASMLPNHEEILEHIANPTP